MPTKEWVGNAHGAQNSAKVLSEMPPAMIDQRRQEATNQEVRRFAVEVDGSHSMVYF
jgi:hypothetical protein